MTRAFLALLPDEQAAADIATWSERNFSSLSKRVPIQNLHMTLSFLGDLDNRTLSRVETELSRLRFNSFELTLDEVGFWPQNETLWLGPSLVPGELSKLAKGAVHLAGRSGIRVSKRPWQAHMTIARRVPDGVQQALFEPNFSMTIDGVALVASSLRPGGSVYDTLYWRQSD